MAADWVSCASNLYACVSARNYRGFLGLLFRLIHHINELLIEKARNKFLFTSQFKQRKAYQMSRIAYFTYGEKDRSNQELRIMFLHV